MHHPTKKNGTLDQGSELKARAEEAANRGKKG